jgi:putative ATP-binding cassette transporter
VRDLTLEVAPSARLLVTSASEHVTDVLQRAIAGIWDAGEGRIVRPPLSAVRFLPDREYLPPGTLHALVTADDEHVPDERIQQALRTTGADRVVEREGGLEVERDWDDALSVEEQRLLGLAHVLIASPRFAVVSHLEVGLGSAGAAPVLDAFAAQGIGCLALGDGAVRHGDFDAVIDIGVGGSWTRTEAHKAAP